MKSNVLTRAQCNTFRKRDIQSNMVRFIKQCTGDLYQTPGPGHIRENWWIFQNILESYNNYIMVEYFVDIYQEMREEVKQIKRIQSKHSPNLQLKLGELFRTVRMANPNSVSFIDACFCVTVNKMIKDGLLVDIEKLCNTNVLTDVWYLSITSSLRGCSKRENNKGTEQIKKILRKNYKTVNEKYNTTYRDGNPMSTVLLKINNKI
ncbi:hypothetical protein KY334_03390 [Candidatus Woesearchaeota archaeon]|nr:hypothetical protein [Candidatus Woesearchaeota archaeon]